MALAKRPLALPGLLLATIAAVAGAALADPYTVNGIAVDVTAENAVLARETAVTEAQVTGLRELLERLTLPSHYSRLPVVGSETATSLVTSYQVEEENVAATRYVAEMAVTYDAEGVQNILEGTGVPIVVDLPPPLLVVPALNADGGLAVFDGVSAWRDAWARESGRNTLLDIVLPLGDLTDLRTLGGQALAANPQTALDEAALRYGTDGAVLVTATADSIEAPTRIDLQLGGAAGWPTTVSQLTVAMEGEPEEVWAAAARRVMGELEAEWKRENLVAFDSLAQLEVAAPLGGLEDWAAIRSGLEEVSAIRRIDVMSFSQAEAELVLNYIGNVDQLQRALAARGLGLSQGAERWRLQRTAGRNAG
jgi:hypothetical protein